MNAPRNSRGAQKSSRMSSTSAARQELLRSLSFDARTITLAAVLIAGVFILEPNVQILVEQQQAIADQQAKVNAAKQSLIDMKNERKRWEDPVYIRSQARDRLYYVMPGEVSYLVMDAKGIDQSDTSGTVGAMIASRSNNGEISSEVRSTKNNWVDSLVETFVRAGVDQPVTKTDKGSK